MLMNVNRQLWSLAHTVLPGVGFVLTCNGAYLLKEYGNTWRVIPAYIMIVFGFLAVLIGVFWTIGHNTKSKMYQRRGCAEHIQVYTIEQPSSFLPSYEDSQGSQVCPDTAPEVVVMVDRVDVVMSLAPPLYSLDCSEATDCMWSWEQPPQYSQVERIQLGEVDADEQRAALSGH